MKNFTCLATFTYPYEYLVIQSVLKQENIRHFFQNETLIGIFPYYSNALGGVRLMVHPEDVEEAKKILDSFQDRSSHLKIV
ncbi:DUF2007 domain-containing protein [Autumnicola psychrophila]|uniref:DUF2007 domain-containing protein n=1 Tax=Autumnicola psychrophila TaxID=3075592 RepID=A0ABU3DR13_9FLAO|nr:DUF2007 domain-containing protein [Zunongwangia sp. F225]MDT0685527.1 DUF2007 domain-containing protein [Zunongwangia sp. F225]